MENTRNDLCLLNISNDTLVLLNAQDQTSATDENRLPFQFREQTGGYITVESQGRKASVFPFEIFLVQQQKFYFGPVPSSLQPIYPEAIRVREDAKGSEHAEVEGGASLFHILGPISGTYTLLVSLGAYVSSTLWRMWSQLEARWILLKFLLLGTSLAPLAAQAPASDPLLTLNTLNAARSYHFLIKVGSSAQVRARPVFPDKETEDKILATQITSRPEPSSNRSGAKRQMKQEAPPCLDRVTFFRNATRAHHLQTTDTCPTSQVNRNEPEESGQ